VGARVTLSVRGRVAVWPDTAPESRAEEKDGPERGS